MISFQFPWKMRQARRYALTVIMLTLLMAELPSMESAHKAFRRDPGSPHWHHGAFHDVKDSVRSDVRRMLHSRAEVIFFRVYLYSSSLLLFN